LLWMPSLIILQVMSFTQKSDFEKWNELYFLLSLLVRTTSGGRRVETLQAWTTWDDMLRNLPDISLESAKSYGLL